MTKIQGIFISQKMTLLPGGDDKHDPLTRSRYRATRYNSWQAGGRLCPTTLNFFYKGHCKTWTSLIPSIFGKFDQFCPLIVPSLTMMGVYIKSIFQASLCPVLGRGREAYSRNPPS